MCGEQDWRQPVHVTQQDPIGIAGGLNLYGYADGDPINNSDPFGLCPGRPACPTGNGLSGAAAAQVFANLSQAAPSMEHELATFVPRNAASAIVGNIIGGAISKAVGAVAARLGTRAVTHFTSVEGAAAIESSGGLRAGSWVAPAGEVAGVSAGTAEKILEIGAGKGAMQATFRVSADALKVPMSGPATSGGVSQFQTIRLTPVSPGTFTPTLP